MFKQLRINSFIIGLICYSSGFLFAQNIDISYINPEFVEVCDKGTFEIILVNRSNNNLTNITVRVQLPSGMTYIPSTVTDGTEENISNLESPVFSIPDFDEDWNFTIEANANCSLVEDINNGKLFANTITTEYDQGRDRIVSVPYRIETGLLIITNVDPTSVTGRFNEVLERRITIKNTRVGKIKEVSFSDFHSGGILISTNGLDPQESPNSYTATFDGTHFRNFGNGDEFLDLNEEIIITESILIQSCLSGGAQSNITVSWGCEGQTCQSKSTSANISFESYPFIAKLEVSANFVPSSSSCNQNYSEILIVKNTGDDIARELQIKIDSNGTVKDTSSIMVTSGGSNIPFQIVDYDVAGFQNCPINIIESFQIQLLDPLEPNQEIEVTWENSFCEIECDQTIPPLRYYHSFRKVCPNTLIDSRGDFIYDFPSIWKDSISFDLGIPVVDGSQHEIRYDLRSEILDDSLGIAEIVVTLPCGYSWPPIPLILDGKSPISTIIDNSNIDSTTVTLQYQMPFSSEHVWTNLTLDYNCLDECFETQGGQGTALVSTCPEFFLECWFNATGSSLVDINGQAQVGIADNQTFTVSSRYINPTPMSCNLFDCEDFNLINICGQNTIDVSSHFFEAYLDFDAEFRRTNIGLKDSNDDRIPDDNSIAPLNEISSNRLIPGDTTLTKASGLVINDLAPVESENVKFRVCFEGHYIDKGLFGSDTLNINRMFGLPLFTDSSGIIAIDAFIKIVDGDTGEEYQCPLNNVRTKMDRYYEQTIINTRPEESYDRWRLLSYAYQLNLPNASLIAGSTIPPGFKLTEGDSVYFEARHKLIYNAGLRAYTLRHYTETAIYNGTRAVEERFSCGRPFQPFLITGHVLRRNIPNFSSTLCDDNDFGQQFGSGYELILGRDNFFPREVRPLITLKNWNLLFPDGFELIETRILEMGPNEFDIRTTNEVIPSNRTGNLYRHELSSLQNPVYDEGFYMNLSHRYVPLSIGCSFTTRSPLDFIFTTDYLNGFCLTQTTRVDTLSSGSAFFPRIPTLNLRAIQPTHISTDQTADWELILENRIALANNTWVSINSPTNKLFDFVLKNTDTNQEIIPVNGIYQLGDIPRNEIRNYELTANSDFCGDERLEIVHGWNCEPIQSLDEFICKRDTSYLFVTAPKTLPPQFEMIIQSPTDLVELCDTIPYHTIEVFNAEIGTGYFIDLSVLMPSGMTIIPGSSQMAYPTASNNFISIPDPQDLGNSSYIWEINDIQNIIRDNGLPGVTNQPDNSFSIRFLSFTNCRSIASAPPIISTSGGNFCDEPANTLSKPGDVINIDGLEADYNTIITIQQDPQVNCQDELELSVEIEFSGTTTEGDSILITLPTGVSYVNNSFQPSTNAINTPPIISQRGTFTTLSWPIRSGLMVNEILEFSFRTIGHGEEGCSDDLIQIQTIQTKEAFCKTINANCEVFVQSGINLSNIEVSFPDWTLTSFIGEAGTTGFDYQISGTNIGNQTESFFTIEFYLDQDANGLISSGDVQVGSQLVNSSDIQNGNFSIRGNLNIPENEFCNIIAIITTDNACICSESQIIVNHQTLNVQNFQPCSGESISIGFSGTSGVNYFWDNSANLSCFDCPNPIFSYENLTENTRTFYYTLTEDNGACPKRYLIEVEVFPRPRILTDDQVICEGDSVILKTTPVQSVNWIGEGIRNPTELNPAVAPRQSTLYIAEFTSGNCSRTDSVFIEVIPGPIVDAGPDTTFCDAAPGIRLSTPFNQNYSYIWMPSNLITNTRIHNPTIINNITSDFTVAVRDLTTGCVLTDIVSIVFGTNPVLTASDDVTICAGEIIELFVNGAEEYLWSNGNTLNCDTCNIVDASPRITTTYEITGANAGGACVNTDSITITVEGELRFTEETFIICEGDTIEIKGIKYTQNAVLPDTTPSQQDECDSTHTINIIVTPRLTTEDFFLCEGDTVILFDKVITGADTVSRFFTTTQGCDSTHLFNVRVLPIPNAPFAEMSFEILEGDSILLSLPEGYSGYRWEPTLNLSCNTCRETTATPSETTVYNGYVLNDEGCEIITRSITISVFEPCSAENINMPNIFSPNNDNRNDIFKPMGIGFEEIISFRIFNRWGKVVYDGNGDNAQWDGAFRNEIQPLDVYIYKIEIGCDGIFDDQLVGDVTLMR